MVRFLKLFAPVAAGLAAILAALGVDCSMTCMRQQRFEMNMRTMSDQCLFSRLTGLPCDPSTGMLLYTLALLFVGLALFFWIGAYSARRE